jgi:hypothetical protein
MVVVVLSATCRGRLGSCHSFQTVPLSLGQGHQGRLLVLFILSLIPLQPFVQSFYSTMMHTRPGGAKIAITVNADILAASFLAAKRTPPADH